MLIGRDVYKWSSYKYWHRHKLSQYFVCSCTPQTGSLISLLKLNYIYILGFLCVAVLCILPLVAFPVIVSTDVNLSTYMYMYIAIDPPPVFV